LNVSDAGEGEMCAGVDEGGPTTKLVPPEVSGWVFETVAPL
jgi:hypothetical protein